jgi:hypothetical protein
LAGDTIHAVSDPLAALTAATFQPHVGSVFTAAAAAATLTLVDVEVGPEREGASRVPFTLTFTSPTPFPQGTYALDHPELGVLDVFLVPRQPLADGLARYDAHFS